MVSLSKLGLKYSGLSYRYINIFSYIFAALFLHFQYPMSFQLSTKLTVHLRKGSEGFSTISVFIKILLWNFTYLNLSYVFHFLY